METILNISTNLLADYREFNREVEFSDKSLGNHLVFGMYHKYSMDEVVEYVKENGIKDPIELVVIGDEYAIVTDGNHRLTAAIKLGLEKVPVRIKRMTFNQSLRSLLSRTIKRRKAIDVVLRSIIL